MFEDDKYKLEEILNVRKKITKYMSEIIEPIYANKYVKEKDTKIELPFEDLEPMARRKTWYHYFRENQGFRSFSFEFYYSVHDKTFYVNFFTRNNVIEFEKIDSLEELFVSLRKEVKKYIFIELYNE
jgi:hypothetical protein